MRKGYLPPILILCALMAFGLWNSKRVAALATQWQAQLQTVGAIAQSGNWAETKEALLQSYADWSVHQTYLHVTLRHDTVDDAEAMYRRAMAFADTRELSEFRAELSDLRDQLRLLAEMERLSLKNVL